MYTSDFEWVLQEWTSEAASVGCDEERDLCPVWSEVANATPARVPQTCLSGKIIWALIKTTGILISIQTKESRLPQERSVSSDLPKAGQCQKCLRQQENRGFIKHSLK